MNIIAKAKDIEIYADKGWEFSFFGSPYHAHREFGAVDIYQNRDFGEVAQSPFRGKVFKVLRFDSPSSTPKSLPEYLILVQNGNYLARIMHVEPSVKEGDTLCVGDELGRFITGGYFYFWMDGGMHVEVRDLSDYLRAKGGYELMPAFEKNVTVGNVTCGNIPASELTGIVTNAGKRNITFKLNKPNLTRIGNRNRYALLDAATTMDYGGVLGKFEPGDEIYFNGIEIGKVNKTGNYMSTFEMGKIEVFANDLEFKGISFMLGRDVVRLLPKKYGKPLFGKGDKLRIKLDKTG